MVRAPSLIAPTAAQEEFGLGTRLTGGFAPDFRWVTVVGGSFGVRSERRSP
jgi:hypothetical protein